MYCFPDLTEYRSPKEFILNTRAYLPRATVKVLTSVDSGTVWQANLLKL